MRDFGINPFGRDAIERRREVRAAAEAAASEPASGAAESGSSERTVADMLRNGTMFVGAEALGAAVFEMLQPGHLGGVASMTPEMVLMLARRRLADLDDTIQNGLDSIHEATKASEALLFRQEVLQALRTAATANGNGPDTELVIDPAATITVGGAPMSVGEALAQAGITDLGAKVKISALDSRLEQVKTEQKRQGSRTEMQMMELQQLMGQRTQTIQLCSNVSKTLLDGASSVIGNMRG
jgi:hypothetical protein